MIAYGLAGATSFAVPFAGILGALVSIGGLVAIAGRRASLTVTLLAGLALRELRGRRDRAHPQPRADALCGARDRVLAARLARRPQHGARADRAAVLRRELAAAVSQHAAYRALTLGEDAAASLGVDIDRTRLMVVIGVALGVGAAVAVAGSIGFIGLVAPHLVRRAVGSDPARVCVPAMLMGAALLTAADIAVRLVPANPNATSVELKVGVVTALIGVPFFLVMIFSERRLVDGAPS